MIASVFALVVVIGAALYALRLRAEQRQHAESYRTYTEGLQSLLDSSREFALAARESVEAVHASIDRSIRTHFPACDAVAIFAQEQGRLVCVYSTPDSRLARYRGRAEYEISDESALPAVALKLGAIAVTDENVKGLHPQCRSAVAIPLPLDIGNTTIVYVSSSSRTSIAQLDAMQLLLEQADPALVLASERDASESRATYDSLTGLLQRPSFELRLRDEIDRCEDSGASLALLYVDADNFKAWNDTFGHHAGDLVLQRIATILQDNRVTMHDLVGRRGGDEFVIVLLDIDRAEALAAAKSIGAAVAFDDRQALIPPEKIDAEPVAVTASIGIAVFPQDAKSSHDLLARADALMYQAKQRGRDRVCYIGDDGKLCDARSSEHDRRDVATRPFSDRRRPIDRSFARLAGSAQ